MSIFLAETIGTMLLVLLGNGVVASVLLDKSKAKNAGWLVITIGWGLAVALAIFTVGKYSGAHINPAVTIGLATINRIPWNQVPIYIIAQMIGAFLGAVLVYLHYLPYWYYTKEEALKLATFATTPNIRRYSSNLLSEIIGTFVLIFGILAIGTNKITNGLNPLLIGLLVTSIGISLGGTTGYAINPARDLGPRIAHFLLPIPNKGSSDWRYSWIPIIGPIIGGVFASQLFNLIYNNIHSTLIYYFAIIIFLIITISIFIDKKVLNLEKIQMLNDEGFES